MGLLDAKAAAGKMRARRKAVGEVSAAPGAQPFNQKTRIHERPSALAASMRERGKPQADRAVVRAKVRDQATIRTTPPGFELGLELRQAVARWPQDHATNGKSAPPSSNTTPASRVWWRSAMLTKSSERHMKPRS
jgi:hypothetical protein